MAKEKAPKDKGKKDKGKKDKGKETTGKKEEKAKEFAIRLVGDKDVISKIQELSREAIQFENTKFNVLSAMDSNGAVQDVDDDICLFCYDIRKPQSLEMLKTKLFDEAKGKMGKKSKYMVAAIGAEYRTAANEKNLVPAKALSDFVSEKNTYGMEIFSSDSRLFAAGLLALKIREEKKN